MNAKVAIEMGVPVYSFVALTNAGSDKEGRSVPAPGQDILTTAREAPTSITSPLLNINYRSRQLTKSRREIKRWVEEEFELKEEVELPNRTSHISKEAERKEKAALNTYGNLFYVQDPTFSPIRGTLASFGLTVDDKQFRLLGRKRGNTCPGVFQKYLTGHPRGAAAWMLNGAIQMLNSGIIPGNRNADIIDLVVKKFEYVLYLSHSGLDKLNSAPYTPEVESAVYLNRTARASYNAKTKSYTFKTASAKAPQQTFDYNLTKDLLAKFPIDNETFIERNFRSEEIAYCQSRPDPNTNKAGKWAAKESVIKAVSSFSLHGDALGASKKAGVAEVKISISHSGQYALAIATKCYYLKSRSHPIFIAETHTDYLCLRKIS